MQKEISEATENKQLVRYIMKQAKNVYVINMV